MSGDRIHVIIVEKSTRSVMDKVVVETHQGYQAYDVIRPTHVSSTLYSKVVIESLTNGKI